MKVYVTGAGASKDAGYPLGLELLREMDLFVRSSGLCFNRFDYSKHWPEMCRWLEENDNLLVSEAYRTRNLENIFSVLDFTDKLRDQSLDAYARHTIKPKPDREAAEKAEADWKHLEGQAAKFVETRRVLLWALEHYLEQKHYDDQWAFEKKEWDYLRSFGNKLCDGDAVITFNYDSTLARVLHTQKKWFPSDGYGFRMVFQKSRYDDEKVAFPNSPIKILHLHGAIGWYRKPAIKHDELMPPDGGAYPIEARTPAPLETQIALDPIFLERLGVSAVDASLPFRPPVEQQIFIHPSFFKSYEWKGSQDTALIELWRKAAELLRSADEIFIIGYSLPEADSAALTLFLTSCDRKKVQVINRDHLTRLRLRRICRPDPPFARSFTERVWAPEDSFKEWLAKTPDCAR
jgi:hypothetical protein